MATNTENLNLKKPSQEGFYNVDDFNENFQKLDDFAGRKDNPHGVTKEQVGLGDVPNVSTNDQAPTYDTPTVIAELSSGEKTSTAFGKIARAIKELISHLSNGINHITSAERTAWNSKVDGSHTSASNPHGITKATVGLGNVPNVATNDQTPTYTDTTTLTTLTSGEKISVALSKTQKAISDLIAHIQSIARIGTESTHGHLKITDSKTSTATDTAASAKALSEVNEKVVAQGYRSSYLSFVGNANEDMVSAAFGKNNEDIITGVGGALTMYGWYKGDNKIENPYIALSEVSKLSDMTDEALTEIVSSPNIFGLIHNNDYAVNSLFSEYASYKKDKAYVANDDQIWTLLDSTITVTTEDLYKPCVILCNMYMGSYGSGQYATFTLNGIEIGKVKYDGSVLIQSVNKLEMKNLEEFGITEAGEYDVKLEFASASAGNTGCNFDVGIYIPK